MDYNKELEIVILITIRNNESFPYDKTHKLFDNKWHMYCYRFIELTHESLFEISCLNEISGLFGYQLTQKGKIRLTELLAERNTEIKKNIATLKHSTNASSFPSVNIIIRIIGSLLHLSSR